MRASPVRYFYPSEHAVGRLAQHVEVILSEDTVGVGDFFCLVGHRFRVHVPGYAIKSAVDSLGVAFLGSNLCAPDLSSAELDAGCIQPADRSDPAHEGHGLLVEVHDHAHLFYRLRLTICWHWS